MTAPDLQAAPPARLAALNVVDHPEGGSQVGLIAKRTYQIRAGRCGVADEQVPLCEIPRVTDDSATLLHDIDISLNRRETDVIVVGKGRPPRKTRSFEIHVRVGGLERRIFAFGDRRCWRDPAGRLRFSDAEPTDEVDLGWTSAYGGVDTVALQKHGDPLEGFCRDAGKPYNPRFGRFVYPRNRSGKGFLIEATDEALASCALPNLEEPAQLLEPERLALGRPELWPSAPLAAGLGWLSYGCFPRTAMLGLAPLYDVASCPPASFSEVRLGVLAEASIRPGTSLVDRLDLRAAQQAAVRMRVPELAPRAAAELLNCHPQMSRWSFALPSEKPTMALQVPGESPVTLTPKIRTVIIEPELERMCLVWVGEHRVPVPIGPGKRELLKCGVHWVG